MSEGGDADSSLEWRLRLLGRVVDRGWRSFTAESNSRMGSVCEMLSEAEALTLSEAGRTFELETAEGSLSMSGAEGTFETGMAERALVLGGSSPEGCSSGAGGGLLTTAASAFISAWVCVRVLYVCLCVFVLALNQSAMVEVEVDLVC